jgi:hypothetical protein
LAAIDRSENRDLTRLALALTVAATSSEGVAWPLRSTALSFGPR